MAITRVPLVDDDGSGTTGTILNNAWLQGLYTNIDLAIEPLYGTWTPADGSGAALVLQAGSKGSWAKYGRLIFLWGQFIYPATSNTLPAVIAGLPAVIRAPVGAAQGFGIARVWYMAEGTAVLQPYNATAITPIKNVDCSGANMIISAVYLTD
jgi:hypothetical protein